MNGTIKKLSELKQDAHNANVGTSRGNELLRKSLDKYGTGRSILVDKNGQIIAGNKTVNAAVALGMEKIKIVKTKGDQVIVVQRTDLDLDTDTNARELAYADNRAGELNLDWDIEVIRKEIENDIIDLTSFFHPDELENMIAKNDFSPEDIEPQEVDDNQESEIVFNECPECGHKWAK